MKHPDLLQLDGPYKNWTKRNRIRRRVLTLAYILVALAVISLVIYNVRLAHSRMSQAGWEHTWITKEEAREIAQYHGRYYGYKITDGEMLLLRDGEEIVVKRRGE